LEITELTLADSPPVVNDTSASLNFSELTPLQFGISEQSFTPASFSKNKSRLAQIKSRRRSGVGVRGSPETNSLILFMARQRMKTPPTFQTPELVRSSPFLPRVASTLRQKMASFQSLMDVEESEVCDPMPRQDSNTGGCIKTRDYLSGEAYPVTCGKDQEAVQRTHRIVEPSFIPGRTRNRQPVSNLLTWRNNYLYINGLTLFAGEDDSTGTSTVKKKKKRVCFGGPLSPEFFDKNLPPSTPLQKGSAPARAPTPGGMLQPRSVLKTPQRSESQTTQAQPDLSSPTVLGASPTLSMPRHCRMLSVGEDNEEKDGERLVMMPWCLYCSVCHKIEVTTLKQPEESEPVKRSTRSAAKTASGKMKRNTAAMRRWNREVDRSLYGSRAYASKNPTLSPITERWTLIGGSQAAQQIPCTSCTGNTNKKCRQELYLSSIDSDLTVTNALENSSEDSITSPNFCKEMTTEEGRRQSGPRVRGRGLKKRKVSVANDTLLSEETLDHTGGDDQTTTHLEASTMKVRESSVNVSELQENETGRGDQAAIEQDNVRSSSETQGEVGVADLHLASWQGDFNFEDVFKPVATRNQVRSVRRSLRNQRNTEHSSNSAGLAWLAWTSPDFDKGSRRRTRGRRLSAAPPFQLSLPEETQDNLTSNL
uniref:PP1-binding domain-containing protein n=1 Tax=Cyclopterus lumpus TaxID=8103 RepID=A0A8C3AQQ3_CYCLU